MDVMEGGGENMCDSMMPKSSLVVTGLCQLGKLEQCVSFNRSHFQNMGLAIWL